MKSVSATVVHLSNGRGLNKIVSSKVLAVIRESLFFEVMETIDQTSDIVFDMIEDVDG